MKMLFLIPMWIVFTIISVSAQDTEVQAYSFLEINYPIEDLTETGGKFTVVSDGDGTRPNMDMMLLGATSGVEILVASVKADDKDFKKKVKKALEKLMPDDKALNDFIEGRGALHREREFSIDGLIHQDIPLKQTIYESDPYDSYRGKDRKTWCIVNMYIDAEEGRVVIFGVSETVESKYYGDKEQTKQAILKKMMDDVEVL